MLDKPQEFSYLSVVFGGFVSGTFVTTLVHPLDLVKVRMQLYPDPISTEAMARRILRCEGIPALYNGLSAAYLRQVTFSTTRLAVYYGVHERYMQKYGARPGLAEKLNIGVFSGLVGGLAGNPSEVALVRMMSDCRRDPCSVMECRKEYRGAFHALYKIAKEEGWQALWRGGTLTLTRAVCLSVIQLGAYAQSRETLYWLATDDDSVLLHVTASFMSGFITAVLTLPVDTLKTNYQIRTDKMTVNQVLLERLRMNGAISFWPGFFPYFLRISLHSALSLYTLRQINEVFKAFGLFQRVKE